jgi:hypothetical protein
MKHLIILAILSITSHADMWSDTQQMVNNNRSMERYADRPARDAGDVVVNGLMHLQSQGWGNAYHPLPVAREAHESNKMNPNAILRDSFRQPAGITCVRKYNALYGRELLECDE